MQYIKVDITIGNCLSLSQIPQGTVVHNVQLKLGGGESKAPIGRKALVTPWRKKASGLKTRDWAAEVKIKTVMFEVLCPNEVTARGALLAMHKLPIKCKIVCAKVKKPQQSRNKYRWKFNNRKKLTQGEANVNASNSK